MLDMTRVLAGVSDAIQPDLRSTRLTPFSLIVLKYWEIWGEQDHPYDCETLSKQALTLYSAEVIKIEHPVRGDDTRAWGPPYANYKPGSKCEGPGESAYFLGVSTWDSKEVGHNW